MTTRKIAFAAVIGAAYAVLTMILAPIGFGQIQFRIAEALCILPFFFPFSAWGLFIGCAAANILLSPYGIIDAAFGSLATLLAALCTMYIGKRSQSIKAKILACLPPVIFNGIIVGAVIAYGIVTMPGVTEAFWPTYTIVGLQVAGGELAVLYALGLPLLILLPKTGFFKAVSGLYPGSR